jgi:hypothetical protein
MKSTSTSDGWRIVQAGWGSELPMLKAVAFLLLFGLTLQASAFTNPAKLRRNIDSHESP